MKLLVWQKLIHFFFFNITKSNEIKTKRVQLHQGPASGLFYAESLQDRTTSQNANVQVER
jgi:hypothetical protein